MATETEEPDVYIHGRNGAMTEEEYFDLYDQLDAAKERGDKKEYKRISRMIPITADVAMAFKTVYGRDFIVSAGFDVTEANMKFGEGWLDEQPCCLGRADCSGRKNGGFIENAPQ